MRKSTVRSSIDNNLCQDLDRDIMKILVFSEDKSIVSFALYQFVVHEIFEPVHVVRSVIFNQLYSFIYEKTLL